MNNFLIGSAFLAVLIPAIAQAASPPGAWTVESPITAPATRIGVGMTIAHDLLAALHREGYPLVHIVVDRRTRTIRATIVRFSKAGLFSGYLPRGGFVTTDRLKSALPLLSAAARSYHDRVNLGVAGSDLVPTWSVAPGQNFGGGIVLSSAGPRYAGSDVASGYGWWHAGGYDMSGSVTRGLPGWTPKQSHDGSYLGENFEIEHPTPDGVLHVDFSRAHFLTGGRLRPLDLNGTITQISAGDRYPILDGRAWLRGGLTYSADHARISAVGFGTDQQNLSAYAGIVGSTAWRGTAIDGRATVYRGISGVDRSSGSPNILGAWTGGYAVERASIGASRAFGPVTVAGSLGGQHGSYGTPQVDQAYIGGEGRGSAYFTGAYAGRSGFWYDARVSKSRAISFRIHGAAVGATPFAEIDGGTVFQDAGPSVSLASAGFGVQFSLIRHLGGSIGYSHSIGSSPGGRASSMLNFDITSSF